MPPTPSTPTPQTPPTPPTQPTPAPAQPPVNNPLPSAMPPMPPSSPTPTPVVSATGSSNKKMILIIVAVMAFLIAGGATAYFLFKPKAKTATTNSTNSNSNSSNNTTKTTQTAAKTCLVKSDYDSLFGWKNDIEYTADNMHTDNVHFKPDSTEYEDEQTSKGTIENYGTWYKEISKTRQVKLILEGGTNDTNTDAASLKLAQARADQVKTDAIAAGVPAELISTRVQEKKNDTAIDIIDRVVVFYVDPTCSATTSTTTTPTTGR